MEGQAIEEELNLLEEIHEDNMDKNDLENWRRK
jgi:hypothetical protein